MRFRLTPAERRARFSEGRWGWANPKRMTRKEFIGLRDRMYQEKMKRRQQKSPNKGAAPGMPKKRGGKLKWLILLIIIGAAAYYYLKYVKKII